MLERKKYILKWNNDTCKLGEESIDILAGYWYPIDISTDASVYYDGEYVKITFFESGTFSFRKVIGNTIEASVYVIAAGGTGAADYTKGGDNTYPGGGGAGGVSITNLTLSEGLVYNASIGNPITSGWPNPLNGENSYFSENSSTLITTYGGGGAWSEIYVWGGKQWTRPLKSSGGSGCGGSYYEEYQNPYLNPQINISEPGDSSSGTPSHFGFPGGPVWNWTPDFLVGGGGGGATGPGINGAGGPGISLNLTDEIIEYAQGGNLGTGQPGTRGSGGKKGKEFNGQPGIISIIFKYDDGY